MRPSARSVPAAEPPSKLQSGGRGRPSRGRSSTVGVVDELGWRSRKLVSNWVARASAPCDRGVPRPMVAQLHPEVEPPSAKSVWRDGPAETRRPRRRGAPAEARITPRSLAAGNRVGSRSSADRYVLPGPVRSPAAW